MKKQNNIFIGVKDLIATIYETKSRFIYLFLSFFVASFFVVMDFTIAICFDYSPLLLKIFKTIIPYSLICFLSFFFFVFAFFYSLYRYWRKNAGKVAYIQVFITFLVSFIFSGLGSWLLFDNYYDGVKRSDIEQFRVLSNIVKDVLQSDNNDDEKKIILTDLNTSLSNKKGILMIIKTKKSEFFRLETEFKDDIKRIKENYSNKLKVDERYFKIYQQETLKSKGINKRVAGYEITSIYARRPYYDVALIRALTFSILPDFILNDYSFFEYPSYNISKVNEDFFYIRKAYSRSTTFWYLFIIFTIILTIESARRCYAKKIQNELNKVSNNMSSLFYSAYSHLQREVDGTLAMGRNKLQHLTNNYQLLKDDEIEALDNYLVTSARKERHDLNNKWTSQEVYQNSEIVKKYINGILEDLKNIPAAISIKLERTEVSELLRLIDNLVVRSQDRTSGLVFEKIFNGAGFESKEANRHHFESIVSNLIGNSKEATQRYKKVARESNITNYKRETILKTDIITQDSQDYLKIEVSDNGGGFTDVDKIYKEAINSSKTNPDGSQRLGEGTSYIKVFSELMHGKIIAENIETNEGFKGARTTILFPIYKI